MRGKPWTDAELKFLALNSSKFTREEIAKHINRSIRAVHSKCLKLKLKIRNGRFRAWTEDEIAYLKANVGLKPMAQIANDLGRSKWCTFVFASKLKLTKHAFTRAKIADLLGVCVSTVTTHRDKLDQHWCKLANRTHSATIIEVKQIAKSILDANARFKTTGRLLQTSVQRLKAVLDFKEYHV